MAGYASIGSPLTIQPEIRITDLDGKTLEGKYAIAYSWIEPDHGKTTGSQTLISASKYFTMENTISMVSDDDGIATFKNLTITGSYGLMAYIMISVDGIV